MDVISLSLKSEDSTEVKLAQMKSSDGQIVFESEDFEIGSALFVVSEEGNIPAPTGSYEIEDGYVLTVDEQGVITAKTEVASEVEPEAGAVAAETEMAKTENAPNKDVTPKKIIETMTQEVQFKDEEITKLQAELKESQDKFIEMEKKFAEHQEEMLKLQAQIEAAPSERTKHNPESDVAEKLQVKLSPNRAETLQDRVYATMFSTK